MCTAIRLAILTVITFTPAVLYAQTGSIAGEVRDASSLQVSATFQSVPGPALSANYTVTNATAAANDVTLGRAFSGGSATIALIEPNTLYGDRLNQTDLRFARIFNYGRYRLQGYRHLQRLQ